MVRLDPYKIMHWLNARKITVGQAGEKFGLPTGDLERRMAAGATADWDDATAAGLADLLDVDLARLARDGVAGLAVVTRTADDLAATCRPIDPDGIHFYNYYMAAPPGAVAPVILDILCPADRLPQFNNGHLEPAITVNLGPGDIHGRWGTDLDASTWQVMATNTGNDNWIVGDSYVEPSFLPHSYSLVTDVPARMVLRGLPMRQETWL